MLQRFLETLLVFSSLDEKKQGEMNLVGLSSPSIKYKLSYLSSTRLW